ncbi:hypothetical protein BFW01_g10844 [Lasiodiplodia theobromae]|uniref:Uncharacterized protein n=1 Tax=Lasiodiplodia theobromae TaxID=45133 RepID=A0A8H7IQ23_9PEZI|nr:hypothetical protein BFW01_g10844 [Lasiodiplodia theobromae]
MPDFHVFRSEPSCSSSTICVSLNPSPAPIAGKTAVDHAETTRKYESTLLIVEGQKIFPDAVHSTFVLRLPSNSAILLVLTAIR